MNEESNRQAATDATYTHIRHLHKDHIHIWKDDQALIRTGGEGLSRVIVLRMMMMMNLKEAHTGRPFFRRENSFLLFLVLAVAGGFSRSERLIRSEVSCVLWT